MTNIISATKNTQTFFDYNYYNSQWRNGKEYLTHNADIYNHIIFKGVELPAVYQDGQSYFYNDLCQPKNIPELISEGTHEILWKINHLYEKDFDKSDYIQEIIKEIDDELIQNDNDLWELYVLLMENNENAKRYYKEVFNEETGFEFDILTFD